jgi:hypothetical protein
VRWQVISIQPGSPPIYVISKSLSTCGRFPCPLVIWRCYSSITARCGDDVPNPVEAGNRSLVAWPRGVVVHSSKTAAGYNPRSRLATGPNSGAINFHLRRSLEMDFSCLASCPKCYGLRPILKAHWKSRSRHLQPSLEMDFSSLAVDQIAADYVLNLKAHRKTDPTYGLSPFPFYDQSLLRGHNIELVMVRLRDKPTILFIHNIILEKRAIIYDSFYLRNRKLNYRQVLHLGLWNKPNRFV